MSSVPPRKGREVQPELGRWFRFVRTVTVNAQLMDTGLGYPGLIAGNRVVRAELWECLDSAGLAELDVYERFDPEAMATSEYVRGEIEVADEERTITAHTYWYNFDTSKMAVVESGSWLTHINCDIGFAKDHH